MDFFGIGIAEIILISLLGFVVLGPERLQAAGRSLGQMVAQLLAWQQQSPEAQLVSQMRKDFEREIVDLRDEIVRAKRQLDVSEEVKRLQQDTQNILSRKALDRAPAAASQPPPEPSSSAAAPDDDLLTHLLREEEQQRQNNTPPPSEPEHPVESRSVPRKSAAAAEPPPAPEPAKNGKTIAPVSEAVLDDQQRLMQQVEALQADLQSLQEQLRMHGLIAPERVPPSQAHPPERETSPSP